MAISSTASDLVGSLDGLCVANSQRKIEEV
jgi:hypothetical protein